MVGRYPFGVLFVDFAANDVDPNVHPTKSDVRLRYTERVLDVVREAIGSTLKTSATERLERSLSLAPRIETNGALPAAAFTFDGAAQGATFESTIVPMPLFGNEAELQPQLRVLAQLDATYVIATDGEALVLVDQHAAHERVVFEELARNAQDRVASDPLLVPHLFELG